MSELKLNCTHFFENSLWNINSEPSRGGTVNNLNVQSLRGLSILHLPTSSSEGQACPRKVIGFFIPGDSK